MPLPTPTLLTARLRLRPCTSADSGALFALHSNAHVLRYWDAPPWTERCRPIQVPLASCRHRLAPRLPRTAPITFDRRPRLG